MKETQITVQVFNSAEEIDKKLKNMGFIIVDKYKLNDFYFTANKDVQLNTQP